MLSSTNTVADVETLYARLGERDYEAVMSYLADDIVWIVADNSPLADRSPYNGLGEVRSGVFERLTNRTHSSGNRFSIEYAPAGSKEQPAPVLHDLRSPR